MKSEATTVKQYLAELPAERREAISAVRRTILANLPPGYEEVMNWGMITYQVPLARYPETYNGQPLLYVALASQKRYMTVYLMGIYGRDETTAEFEAAYRSTGKSYDVGKSCVRFRRLDDLPRELIGDYIRRVDVDRFISRQEEVRIQRT